MSEPQTAPTSTDAPPAEPASPSGAEPSKPTAPEGFELVPVGTQRLADQARGLSRLTTQLTQAGIKDPDQVKELLEGYKVLSQLKERNVDPTQLLNTFSGSQPEPTAPQPPNGSTQEAKGFLTIDDFNAAMARERAMTAHQSASEAQERRIQALADKVTPEGAPAFVKRAIRAGIEDQILEKAAFYPEGHPLHSDREIQPVADSVWSEIEKTVASELGQFGTAPEKQAPSGPSATIGGGGGQGPGSGTTDEPVPFLHQPKENRLAEARKIAEGLGAMSAGAPVSALG